MTWITDIARFARLAEEAPNRIGHPGRGTVILEKVETRVDQVDPTREAFLGFLKRPDQHAVAPEAVQR